MLIRTHNLTKIYPGRFSVPDKPAVVDACIDIAEGETVGLVGESGSGKTTIGHMLTGLIKPSSGEISYCGDPVTLPLRGELRRKLQIIFQHPEISFNPRLPLIKSIEEPYRFYRKADGLQALYDEMGQFGIYHEHLNRLPAELSGGELQRASIMRVLAVRPSLLVLDEVTSMLDSISQAQVLQILKDYQKQHQVSYLFITHHEALCKVFCDKVYRIHEGRIVGLVGSTSQGFNL
ncbi:MAG: ABC transporter ATP-binding protein [Syntrophaceticus sp.]|jgi:peptide/nickel transport system ATP-binding protein